MKASCDLLHLYSLLLWPEQVSAQDGVSSQFDRMRDAWDSATDQ